MSERAIDELPDEILPGREGAVSLHGASYRFWSADATTWENEHCTDMLNQICWALWRQ